MFNDIPIRSNELKSILKSGDNESFLDAQFQEQLKKR